MFLVTVNHFAHFGATFTSMRLLSGKKSLQLNEILKMRKHIYTDTIELKVMRKLSPRKKQFFGTKKKMRKNGFLNKNEIRPNFFFEKLKGGIP